MQSVTTWVLLAGAIVVCWQAGKNVFSDDPQAVEIAREVSCRGTVCVAELTEQERLPWGQRMRFAIDGAASEVWCQRALWIWGPVQCHSIEVDGR